MRSIVQTSAGVPCVLIGLSIGTDSLPEKKQKRSGAQFEFGNVSGEYDNNKKDELDRYLSMRLDLDKIKENPLSFWREHINRFPMLSLLPRRLHSIPITTVSIERTFSGGVGGGEVQVFIERRTNLSSWQVENSLFVRSVLMDSELM
jgi:hypothetical protein